ncbi:MAG: hypothetical protein RBR05_05650 [Candidatus Methanomethylophilaceae archaeon]|nr:hypothetical protein [Candidatus Methanomethylophilaceae archaeon]
MIELFGFEFGPEVASSIIVTILTAIAFVAIWYLKDYEDWKACRYDDYIADLEKNGESAKKPDVIFGRPYMYAMGLSMAISVVLAVIATPYIVGMIASPEEVTVAIYGATAFFVTIVLGFMTDYFIARPVADHSMKARYVAIQEGIIAEITSAFPSVDKTAEMTVDDILALITEKLKK